MTVKVKICGITRVADAIAAVEAGADFIGLNFYEQSPRYVTVDAARAIKRATDGRAAVVGVFVDAGRERIGEVNRAVALNFVQVYSDEDERAAAGLGLKVIRALRLRTGTAPSEIESLCKASKADYLLFDSYDSALYGGTGKAIDVATFTGIDLTRAFIAGGLNPDRVVEVARLTPYGVDVASGVESAPGTKDHDKVRSFIANAKRS